MPNQSLSLSQSQHLQMVLAPQLRQSLEMLQAPILELRAMIQKEIEQNPTLEDVPPDAPTIEIEPNEKGAEDARELDFDKEFEMLARLDDEWRDYFFQDLQTHSYSRQDAERRQYFLDSLPQTESLQEHLMGQLMLTGMSDTDRQIAEMIIGSINEDGYLTTTVEDLAESTATDVEHLRDILVAVQDFHPTGVGAANLRECLLIQLERQGKLESLAADIVRGHLNLLGAHKIQDIARALKITSTEVNEAAKIIATLDPKPGSFYSSETAAYVLPEIVVQKIDGEYVIILNDDQLPHVRISQNYRKLLKDADTKTDVKQYIRERIRSGAFLIKSIQQRQDTIYRIASEIVSRQTAFLDHGVSKLKPMTMAEVAETVGVHETTVSRSASGKYMKTPSGTYELKYFFTPGIKTADGTSISNKTVKDKIATMVAAEDPSSPLSDQEIMSRLQSEGIKIARRTIAKYRLVLRIPPSHMRKLY